LILSGIVFAIGGSGTTLLLSRFTEDSGTELNIKMQLKVKVTLMAMRFFMDTPFSDYGLVTLTLMPPPLTTLGSMLILYVPLDVSV
jgi:hypothetical protein